MSRPEDQIVFEDLHGVHEDKPITVDLDADRKDDGIESAPDGQSVDLDAGDDDLLQIDELRTADDDAVVQPDDEQQASTGSEDDDYSKKVKARIAREKRVTKKERERGDYWEQQARQLAKQGYERDKESFEKSIEQADSAIEQVQTDLERAIEDGNTKDQVRLTNHLTDLKADKARAEFSLNDLSDDGNLEPFDGKISPEGRKSTKSEAQTWMEDRSDWYRQAGFERATRLANRLDKEVFDDGFDPATHEYFEELDKRMKAKMPELYDEVDDTGAEDDVTDDTTDDRRGKNVVAPVGGNESRHQRTTGSKVELTPEDFDTMREFNLDPNDPEVLKEFARNKAEAEGRR